MFFWSRSDDSSCGSPVGSNHSDQSHPSSLIIHTQPLLTGCFSFFFAFPHFDVWLDNCTSGWGVYTDSWWRILSEMRRFSGNVRFYYILNERASAWIKALSAININRGNRLCCKLSSGSVGHVTGAVTLDQISQGQSTVRMLLAQVSTLCMCVCVWEKGVWHER